MIQGGGGYLTDIVYFSIGLDATGALDTDLINPATLAALRAMRDRDGVRIFVAVGGWGRSRDFAAVAADPDLRVKAAQALVAFCRENELDGVDFDWEFPANARENDAYVALLVEVHRAFAPHSLKISVALASWQDLGATGYASVDRVHLMSYDHEGRHATFAQAAADVRVFLERGVLPEKLLLGVPFYGRDVHQSAVALTYAEIVALHHPAPGDDEAGGVYFNGIATIQKKTRYAQDQGLGGVMIWELGQDTTDDTSLLRAIQLTSD